MKKCDYFTTKEKGIHHYLMNALCDRLCMLKKLYSIVIRGRFVVQLLCKLFYGIIVFQKVVQSATDIICIDVRVYIYKVYRYQVILYEFRLFARNLSFGL